MSTLSLEEYANNFFFERALDTPQKVLFGSGISRKVGEYAKSLGTHALLVSDPGIRDAGHVANIRSQIEEAAVKVTTYDQSVENPTESSIDRCVAVAKDANVDLIIGLGGGSSMDTAKGCNFIFSNGGKMEDFLGCGKSNSTHASDNCNTDNSGNG
jgi:alcohol dehydrogenase